ncbi:multiheme c-type cytochrome [Niabella yanshanensis]|uniref:Multiheme c-type cytochrome n=1 Tax=Niabella yanshanensis TaxID=577386 RepID=A0ABZ0W4A9_9BACT|nr:multiheme c-type cytochrome [Niabella yanshanensis]WQD36930.1 multiheme c-type cytochrome [Niabella yanshanensis]
MVAIVFLLWQCRNGEGTVEKLSKVDGSQYVGSKACESCHKEIVQQHLKTAHYNTTKSATNDQDIIGGFTSAKNLYDFGNGNQVRVEKRGDSVYQVAYVQGDEMKIQSICVLFGAGKHAQSYASWVGDKLVQLPLTYFVEHQALSNSPGYPNKIVYNRVITSRCMECHTTFAEVIKTNGNLEEFSKKSVMYGISCEKCHGPAADHVAFHTKNPKDTIGKNIISTKGFTRQQQIDMCAVCHSGTMNELQPPFSFKSGDQLSDFYAYNIVAPDIESLDVHGNQYGMLSLSECFVKSEMTCNSCHNSHEREDGHKNVFSQKCMNCHSRRLHNFCSNKAVTMNRLEENCIDCHMPARPSNAIMFTDQGTKKKTGVQMRTHYIKIYPEETKTIVAYINKK